MGYPPQTKNRIKLETINILGLLLKMDDYYMSNMRRKTADEALFTHA